MTATSRHPVNPAIWRHTGVSPDPGHVNRIVNHPEVHPWLAKDETPLDLASLLGSPDIYALFGQFGGQIYQRLQPGLFEAHSAFLPSGRGRWALAVTEATLRWMFTRTEAVEILTRCPAGNVRAKALAKAIGGRHAFTAPNGWARNGKPVVADIYSLTIQDWMVRAPGLVERGRWFHERLESEFERLGIAELAHADDETHDRYVGAAADMVLGGQPQKAVVFYNRIAVMMGWQPVAIKSVEPLALDIGSAIVMLHGDGFTACERPARAPANEESGDQGLAKEAPPDALRR
jgi:hypothetical protein